MTSLIQWALKFNRTILLVFGFFILAGTFSYISIPKESTPDVEIPMVVVSVILPGISPGDAERLLITPLEQNLQTIGGVKKISSSAYDGGGHVIVEFSAGAPIHKAIQNVREKVDIAKADFPPDTLEPVVEEVNLSLFPVLVVQLSGTAPPRTLYKISQQLKEKVEGISSVLEAKIKGDQVEIIEIMLKPEKLESYRISSAEAIQYFHQNHLMVPSGPLANGSGSFNLRAPGLLSTAEEIANLPIKINKDIVVTLKDIAEVKRTYKDPTSITRIQGQPAVSLEIVKRIGENIIDTIHKVETTVNGALEPYKGKIQLSFTQDSSGEIKDMLNELQNSIFLAILLVMIVIIYSLGVRSALLVGVSIPASFLMGIFILSLLGITLNVVVLFSLILSVGMLVDGAIIVVEYADRKMLEGARPYDAFLEGATRMAWPVITTTLTVIVVFLPLLFWPGVVGQFMKYLPITLIATLVSSILVALLFIPVLGSAFGKPHSLDASALQSIIASETGDLNHLTGLTRSYIKILSKALRKPWRILGGSLGILIILVMVYIKFGNGVEFFPSLEPDNAVFKIRGRGNLSLQEKDRLVRQIEQKILPLKVFKTVYTTVLNEKYENDDVIGRITVEFTPWQTREKATHILKKTVEAINVVPGIYVEQQGKESGPSQGKDIQLLFMGDNPTLLAQEVTRVRQYFEQQADLKDIEDTRPLPGIEWKIDIDRVKAAMFGANIAQLSGILQLLTDGLKLGAYRPNDSREEIDIVLRLPPEYRTIEQLDNFKIGNERGLVPLQNFIHRTAIPKVSTVERVNGKRALRLYANTDTLLDTKVTEINTWLSKNPPAAGVDILFQGEEEEKQQTQDFLGKAFGIAIFLVSIILVTQFNSFFSTFLVLSAIILSTIGVLAGLLITGQPFGIVMSGIGVIALAGIIVSNNIIFIDTFDHIMKTHSNIFEAVLRTAAQRLRPILLTKITCILGLLPIMLRLNIDFINRSIHYGAPSSEWWVQLANAIVFGVLFASTITLFFTPSALIARHRYQHWRQSR